MTQRNPTEKDMKRQGKALLDKYGWFYWCPPANQFGSSGISDLHAVVPGIFMVVEFKFGSNKPSALQKGFLTTINAAGHFAFVVNEKNMIFFDTFLGAFARSTQAVQKGGEKAVDPVDGSLMLNAIHELTKDYQETSQ